MRLTDKRFLGDGFYQPKDNNERKEIILSVELNAIHIGICYAD